MTPDLNVLALEKGEERYVFVYAVGREDEISDVAARWAADSELSFDWQDAAELGEAIEQGRCLP